MTTLAFDVLWRDRGASKGMQDLARHTDRTAKSFHALKVGAGIALVAAAGAAVKFGTSSVKAYVEAQTAQVKLQDAFAKFPKLADTNIGSLRKLNSQLALKTKFDDDATASGQAVLAQFGLTGQQLTKLTPLLQDYAAKTGKDLPAAAGVLGKAFLGNTRALKAIGIDYKMTGDKGKDFANIQRLVNEKVGGFAEKEGKSAAGQAAILRNQFGELQESAGKQLLPALLKVGQGLLRLVGFVQDNSAIFGTFGKTVKTIFSSIAESIGLGKISFKTFSDFIATHQADITSGIIAGGKAFIGFGKILATVAKVGLQAFAFLADSQANMLEQMLGGFGLITHGAALAFGWIPGVGKNFKNADVAFRGFAAGAVGGLRSAAAGARSLADGVDKKLLPGLNKAGTSLDALGKKEIASARNRDIMAKAENRHRDALTAASAAAKTNGKTLDSNTVSGRANRTALNGLVSSSQNYISKLNATGASSKKVTQATQSARDEFVRVATKMGLSRKRADELANAYFHIPKKSSHKHEQPGMTHAIESVKELNRRIDGMKGKSVRLSMQFAASATKAAVSFFKTVPGSQASGFVNSFFGHAAGGVLPGYTPGRDVHTFISPTGGRLDLSGGEAVMRPEWTKAVGGPKAVAKMNADARSGQLSGAFAPGGVVRINTQTGKIPSATRYWVPAGVAAGSALGSDAIRELGADGRRYLDGIVAKAAAAGGGGGPIGKGGYASALAYARRHRGHPYIFGTLWDCSGFMSALHSIILGQSPHRRYSTTAFHGAHAAGFTRGKSSPFMVGVRPLAGRFGHMAGTLNGVNVESAGGVGVRVGGSARGAHSGMFSWRGGLAKGGVIGDMPFDLLDPQGERYNPELADLVHRAGFHRGGRIGPRGPERVLSPPQNRAFEHLVRVLDRRSGGGAGNTTIVFNAPNFIGSRSEVKQLLVNMARSGDFDVVLARAGRG